MENEDKTQKDENDLTNKNPGDEINENTNSDIQAAPDSDNQENADAGEVKMQENADSGDQKMPEMRPSVIEPKKEPAHRKGGIALLIICVILVTSILTSAITYTIFNNSLKSSDSSTISSSETFSSAQSTTTSDIISTVSNGDRKLLSIPEINRKVNPSVVFITVEGTADGAFGQPQTVQGSGSGIILTKDGYILTNNHVIDGANKVTIKLISGTEYTATIRGRDSKTDLAVCKIAATDLTPAVLG